MSSDYFEEFDDEVILETMESIENMLEKPAGNLVTIPSKPYTLVTQPTLPRVIPATFKQSTLPLNMQPKVILSTKLEANDVDFDESWQPVHSMIQTNNPKWIYPINYPVRDYQFTICKSCIMKNTLVCLPTGMV